MIYTYQIIDGFESLLGPETIHLPMVISLVAFMRYPTGEADHWANARELWWQAVIFHAGCTVHNLLKRSRVAWSANTSQLLVVLLIIGQAYLTITSMLIVINSIGHEKNED